MTNLPGYFEHLKELGDDSPTELYPFSYDQDRKMFSVADQEIVLAEFDPYTFNSYALNLDGRGINIDEMPNHPALLPNFGALIVGPKLHEWADKHPREVAATAVIMKAAFASLIDNPEAIPTDVSHSHMGFAAGLREYGGIGLQVMGNCACLGPDPMSHIIENQFEQGFAEYDLHNTDSQVQRASIFAGIGHLARLASE